MREIKSIDAQKWLSTINSEADPTLDRYDIEYVTFNEQFAVVIYSGYGTFVSKLVKDSSLLPELEKELIEKYNSAKTAGNVFNPGIGLNLK